MISLVADIGGTNSRLALVDAAGQLTEVRNFTNAAAESFDDILNVYLRAAPARPGRAVVAAAGPVKNQSVTMTNLGWHLTATDLQQAHGIRQAELVNDFAALAWATLFLLPADLEQIGGGQAEATAVRAVIGPGTGLGVGALVPAGGDWSPVAGEGGHVTLAAGSPAERALLEAAAAEFGHCSAERLLSGPGLSYIYRWLGGDAQRPRDVTVRALGGEAMALQAFELFAGLLGLVAGDVALTFGARGGVYLAGGILPGLIDLLAASAFRTRFESKGRLSGYLASIPTFVVTAENPALTGLAGYVHQAQKKAGP